MTHPPTLPTDSEKLEEVLARLRRMEDVIVSLVGPKKKSLEEQARAAGVCRQTLWRRNKRAQLSRLVNGN